MAKAGINDNLVLETPVMLTCHNVKLQKNKAFLV